VTQPRIPLSGCDISQAEIDAVTAVLRSGRLSIGPQVRAFEEAVAAAAGRKYAVAVNSGTSALHLAIRALDIREGDEVVTTPFSFISSTNCILFERATPVFADINPDSYNLDPAAAEAAITPRTKAILAVEAFGNMAHFGSYEQIAHGHGLALIEDCCEALGGRLGDRPAGNFGDCGAFAFYPNKQITTGEGGMLVTDRQDLRDLCLSMRNQGRDTGRWHEHARLGYNYRMSEMTAALGVVQMGRLEAFLAARRRAAAAYAAALAELADDVHLPPRAEPDRASWFVYVVRLADRFTRDDRDAVVTHMNDAGIHCSNYFPPIHLQPYIREMLGTKEGDLPVTERVAARTITLPFFADIADEQIRDVAGELKNALAAVGH